MLKAINCKLVKMIPKHGNDVRMKDMRPISLCTTMYKIISKVLTNRMREVNNSVQGDNQSTFSPGRVIHDSNLLAQEQIMDYEKKQISPRVMIPMNIQKEWDSIEWATLEGILRELGFPEIYVTCSKW